MGYFLANGTRVTKGAFPTSAIPAADLPKVVSQDIFLTRDYGQSDPKPEGSIKEVFLKAGTVLTQKQIDALFDPAEVITVSPKNGPAVGGTVVTIEGRHLDGVSAVTFGGTAGTALTVVSPREIRVTTPAKTAGAHPISLTDDSGPAAGGNFTYA